MIDELKKAYEPLRGQKIAPLPLMKMFDKFDTNKDVLIQLCKQDIPFVSELSVSRLILKHGMTGEDIKKLKKGGQC